MAVELTDTSANFIGTGILSTYAAPIYANDDDQIKVYVDSLLATLGDDYVLNGLGSGAGISIDATFALNAAVYVERDTPIKQEVDTQNNETILEDVIDAAFDKLTMMIQERAGETARALLVPRGEAGAELPAAVDRADRLLGFLSTTAMPTISPFTMTQIASIIAGVYSPANTTLADLVTFINTGAGAQARTVQARQRDWVSVLDYIPVSKHAGIALGVNTDDLMSYFIEAMATGKAVYCPKGTYTLNQTELPAGACLFGDGMGQTILKAINNNTVGVGWGMLFALAGSSVTTVDNITIRDMTLLDDVVARGFLEQHNLIHFSGVRNLLIERVEFKGFRSDGVCLIGEDRVNNLTLPAHFRHNYNVTIRDCVFDGVNNDNRNGISIIDCDGLLIQNCEFFRCSRANMPGPIDIEPNGFAYYVVQNIVIEKCRMKDCGGNYGAVGVLIPDTVLATPVNITIRDIENRAYVGTGTTVVVDIRNAVVSATTNINNVVVDNIVGITVSGTVNLFGVKGGVVSRLNFETSKVGGAIGSTTGYSACRDILLKDVNFTRCANVSDIALVIGNAANVTFQRVVFDDVGVGAASGYAILFLDGSTSSGIMLDEVTVRTPTGKTGFSIVKQATHVLTPSTNRRGRRLALAGLTDQFEAADKFGAAALVAGTVTIAAPGVTANSRIVVQRQTDGGTIGCSYSITRINGTSFTITAKDNAGATQAADTSTVAYQMEAA